MLTPGLSTASLALGLALAAAALVWAAWSDTRQFRIPNRACVLLGVAYLLAAPAMASPEWLTGVATGTVVLIIGAVLFAHNVMGGGDVKLAAGIGLWAGPSLLAGFAVTTSLASLALAGLMLATPLPRLFGSRGKPDGERTGRLSQPMPFAVPLAAGGLWVIGSRVAALV